MARPVQTITGGTRRAAQYSGAVAPAIVGTPGVITVGPDVQLASGPGRVISITPHQTVFTLSGVVLNLYDGAGPVSGGPVAASGHIPLGGLTAPGGVSGQVSLAQTPIPLGLPFFSGLCMNSRSGQPGATITWMPDPTLLDT